jgi:hypothetical protein
MIKSIRILSVFFVALMIFAPYVYNQDLSQFEHLREPKISTLPDQKMLVVEAKGDPNVVGGKAFGLLFQLYFSMKETPKGPNLPAPQARWPVAWDTPKSEWKGLYGLPVPETITELPAHQEQSGLKASLMTWKYGEVAEILHVGPYTQEEPTIKRLTDFISGQGYTIAGDHEEEYIKGPSMTGPGDPEKYITIIRYQVKKK